MGILLNLHLSVMAYFLHLQNFAANHVALEPLLSTLFIFVFIYIFSGSVLNINIIITNTRNFD